MTPEQKNMIRLGRTQGKKRSAQEAYASMIPSRGHHVMDWKRYKIYPFDSKRSIEVEINHSVADQHIQMMILQKPDSFSALQKFNNDITTTFLMYIGRTFGHHLFSDMSPKTLSSIISATDGWIPFTASNGIMISSVKGLGITFEGIVVDNNPSRK